MCGLTMDKSVCDLKIRTSYVTLQWMPVCDFTVNTSCVLTMDTSVCDLTMDTSVCNLKMDTSVCDLTMDTSVCDLTMDVSVRPYSGYILCDLTVATSVCDLTVATSVCDLTMDTSVCDLTITNSLPPPTISVENYIMQQVKRLIFMKKYQNFKIQRRSTYEPTVVDPYNCCVHYSISQSSSNSTPDDCFH